MTYRREELFTITTACGDGPMFGKLSMTHLVKRGVRGCNGGKQINGRKRHILVDTMNLVLLVVVTAGDVQDQKGAHLLLVTLATRFRRLRLLWADGCYAGLPLKSWVRGVRKWRKVKLEIARKPKGQ